MHEPSRQALLRFFEKFRRPMTENNLKQAMMPEGCIVLENRNGTAPGAIIEGEDGKIAIMMPGPPREMAPMFQNQVMPYLVKRPGLSCAPTASISSGSAKASLNPSCARRWRR